MPSPDIAIIGAGLAGATAAVKLGRAGHDVVLIDPRPAQRPEFRCEKLDDSQLAVLRQIGLADDVLPYTCQDKEVWVIRYGRLIDRRPGGRAGIMYHDLVNTIRSQIPCGVSHLWTKATAIQSCAGRPTITLADGSHVRPKLAILATGLNPGLPDQLGIERTMLSPRHSVSIGFDIQSATGEGLTAPALTYFPERPDQLLAYLTLFPVPGAMRANLFVYWQADDPRLQAFRCDPAQALNDYLPALSQFTGPFRIDGRVAIRPVDLVRADKPERPGIVLLGDAYSTSCPAAGTGANKVFTDVEQLCSVHVPNWLEQPAVSQADVAGYYSDPVKQVCEQASFDKAITLYKRSTESSIGLRCWRGARFVAQVAIGGMRSAKRGLSPGAPVDITSQAN